MSRKKICKDSPIPKFIYLKIRRRDGVESLTTLEEGEFKVPIDGCINRPVTNIEPIIGIMLAKYWLYKTNCLLKNSMVRKQQNDKQMH